MHLPVQASQLLNCLGCGAVAGRAAEAGPLRLGEDPVHVRRPRNVSLDRHRPAAGARDVSDHLLRALAIARIIHDDRCTRCRQLPGYLRAYPFRRARDDGDLACQFAHWSAPTLVIQKI
jgi:hypothetical protein